MCRSPVEEVAMPDLVVVSAVAVGGDMVGMVGCGAMEVGGDDLGWVGC